MSLDRFRDSEGSLFPTKLGLLLEDLDGRFGNGEIEHHEELLEEFAEALSRLEQDPLGPMFRGRHVRAGTYPDLAEYLTDMLDLGRDLRALTEETIALQNIIVANFNAISQKESQVLEGVKRIRSMLGDLKLYGTGPLAANRYFTDSFSNLARVDMGSSLLSKKQAAILTEEGVATLNFEAGDIELVPLRRIVVNDASNGFLGNREQSRQVRHADVELALDNNPDTWFEYERTIDTQVRLGALGDEACYLDMTAILSKPSVVNRIVLNPNHFGRRDWIKVRTVETSLDGHNWRSIFDDVPEAEWTVDDEGQFHTLAPENSRFAGMGMWTFLPRKIKFIRFVLEQENFYLSTSYGLRSGLGELRRRYVIGVRDIQAFKVKYQDESQLISRPFESDRDIFKVGVLSNQLPAVGAPLATVSHAVSIDDGQSWYELRPIDAADPTKKEILTFNGGEDSIENKNAEGGLVPVRTLRYRATLQRNTAAFESNQGGENITLARKSEITDLPNGSALRVNLEQLPEQVVSVVRPEFGTVGTKGVPTSVGTMRIPRDGSTIFYDIPFNIPVVWDNTDDAIANHAWKSTENLKINGQKWTRDDAIDNDREYRLDLANNKVVFSAGNQGIEDSTPIVMYLDPEALVIPKESPHQCVLRNPHDGMKGSVRIKHYSATINDSNKGRVVFPPGATELQLPAGIEVQTFKVSGGAVGDNWGPAANLPPYYGFADGTSEFIPAPAEPTFSVDQDNGVVYLSQGTPLDNSDALIGTYTYKSVTEIDADLYKLSGTHHVTIDGAGFQHTRGSRAFLNDELDNTNRIDLMRNLRKDKEWHNTEDYPQLPAGRGTIVPDSLIFPVDSNGTPVQVAVGAPVNATVNIFREEVPFVNGSIEFETGEDEIFKHGLYSVDYRNGLLYTYTNTGDVPAAFDTRPIIFEYCDYTIEYGIGKTIKYTVDGQSIVLDETDVTDAFRLQALQGDLQRKIRVEYDYVESRANTLQELKDYYSPILRDYALIIVPIDPRLGSYE